MILQHFIRKADGNFNICGHEISKSVFVSMEPQYSEVEGLAYLSYNPITEKQTIITEDKSGKKQQYSISGKWDSGDRYILRLSDYLNAMRIVLNDEQKDANTIKKLVEQADTPRGKRKKEYPPIQDLVIALWENLIEKKTKKESGVEELQKLRKAIKAKYPEEGDNNAVSTDEEETN